MTGPGRWRRPSVSVPRPGWLDALDDWRADRVIAEREHRAAVEVRLDLRHRWNAACERGRLGLTQAVVIPGGAVLPGRYPRVIDVTTGTDGSVVLFVELPPGLIVADLEDAAVELAAALLVHRLRFTLLGRGPIVRVELITSDPHDAVTTLPTRQGALTLGPDEYGAPVAFDPAALPHIAMQGQTGGGKSTALYHLMRQITATPGARLVGVDPSGVIFRPLPADPWRISGLADLGRIVEVLAALVAELDARCARIPWDDDRLPCGPDTADPWLFVVLEELPGLLAALTAAGDRKAAELARLHISRLAAEGRKAGLRLVMAAQRFEAQSTAGATVRSNCGLRISFSVENRTAVEFLHDDATPDQIAEHTHATPGVALVSAPGAPLRRVRFPHLTYRDWALAARASNGRQSGRAA